MAKTTHDSLYDEKGPRLYLTPDEREAFLLAAKKSDRQTRTFCQTLHSTGCRISEALCLESFVNAEIIISSTLFSTVVFPVVFIKPSI